MNSKNQHAYSEKFHPTEEELAWAKAKCPDLFEEFPGNTKIKIVKLEHNQDGEIRVWFGIGLKSFLSEIEDHWKVACEDLFVAIDIEYFSSSDEGLEQAFAKGKEWGWNITRKEYVAMNIRPNSDPVNPPVPKRVQNSITGEIYPSIAATRQALNKSDRWIKKAISIGSLKLENSVNRQ